MDRGSRALECERRGVMGLSRYDWTTSVEFMISSRSIACISIDFARCLPSRLEAAHSTCQLDHCPFPTWLSSALVRLSDGIPLKGRIEVRLFMIPGTADDAAERD